MSGELDTGDVEREVGRDAWRDAGLDELGDLNERGDVDGGEEESGEAVRPDVCTPRPRGTPAAAL